jgi:hypothetical protein
MEYIFYDEKNKITKKNIELTRVEWNLTCSKNVHLIASYVNWQAVPVSVIQKGIPILTAAWTDNWKAE